MKVALYARVSTDDKNQNPERFKELLEKAGLTVEKLSVNSIGRKRLNISVKNICDALQCSASIQEAAENLVCSKGYIYKVLGEKGMKPLDFVSKRR